MTDTQIRIIAKVLAIATAAVAGIIVAVGLYTIRGL